jgi:exopolysaccharide biosynthesis polyprenyl glycosylphosphotransferase
MTIHDPSAGFDARSAERLHHDAADAVADHAARLTAVGLLRAVEPGRPATVLGSGPAARRRRGWLIRRLLLAGDVSAVTACCLALDALPLPALDGGLAGRATAYLGITLLMLATFALSGLYGRDEVQADYTTTDDLPAVLRSVTLVAFGAAALATVLGHADDWMPVVLSGAVLLAVLLPLGRSVARTIARRRTGFLQRTVIVGAGHAGQLVARKLAHHPEYGLRLVGLVDDDPRPPSLDLAEVPVLGGSSEIERIVLEHAVERVIVAFSGETHAETLDRIRALKRLDVQVEIVPRLWEVIGPNAAMSTIEGLPMIVLPPVRLSRGPLLVKRSIDIAVAAVGLAVMVPVFAAIAAAIRIEGKGPILYVGERVGRGGRRFRQLKFRTMRPQFCAGSEYGGESAEVAFAALLERDPLLRDEFSRTQKLVVDPRVTRVGRLLRRSSLDELPQLWNVLVGDLSLVGPRPVTEHEMRVRYRPQTVAALGGAAPIGYWDVPRMRPGLTGYWQISGRSLMSFEERIRLDTAYLTGWSLRLDLEIIAKTLRAMVVSRGAY